MTREEPTYAVTSTGATDEELAALLSVLQARASGDSLKESSDRPVAGGWKSYYRTIRAQSAPGRDAWRTPIRF